MPATDNNPELDKLITVIKFYPNKTGEDLEDNKADSGYDDGDTWVFGDAEVKEEDLGTMAFWGVNTDVALTDTSDLKKLREGAELVDSVINGVLGNDVRNDADVAGDFHSSYTEREMQAWNRYQSYINMDKIPVCSAGTSVLKHVHFKGSYPLSAWEADPPSGDYLFRKILR